MTTVFSLISFLLWLYLLALIGRLIFEYVQQFSRSWRPRGVLLVFVSTIYALTDPPLKFLRRLIPPLRMGGVSLDLSFLVLFFVVSLLMRVASTL
ncbi:YGGT family protein [mine drainage metagenome]|uniref:YGGT family protein n=1 Tax=mine drainage metagenome TaxID=410659 RepID=A0A1J5QF12_9ZZZZ